MKILACGLLSAMLLAGTAAALESISQPLPPADTLTMPSERTAPCWPGETASTRGGPHGPGPAALGGANVLLENARYVDAGLSRRRH